MSTKGNIRTWPDPDGLSVNTPEEWRVRRIHRVIGYVLALDSEECGVRMLENVVSVEDHEGCLTVDWSTAPSDWHKAIFRRAWENPVVGDGGGYVEHVVNGRPIGDAS